MIIEEDVDGIFEPPLLTSCIIPKDERSETICNAILTTLYDKGGNLDQWIVVHEKMFGQNHTIPSGSEIHLSKLEGGLVNTDTCNPACLLGQLILDADDHAVTKKHELIGTNSVDNINNDSMHKAMVWDCHNHMQNVWIKSVTICLSTFLNKLLTADLTDIDWQLGGMTMINRILCTLDKEFSLPTNYPKGHGAMFKHWLLKYHLGALLVLVQCTAGSKQDFATESTAALYWNRIYYIEFLDECLHGSNNNILQENLFIALTSIESSTFLHNSYSAFQIMHATEVADRQHILYWTARV